MTIKTSCDVFDMLGNPWMTDKDRSKAFPSVVLPASEQTTHHRRHARLNADGKATIFHKVSRVQSPKVVMSQEGNPEIDQHTEAHQQTKKSTIFNHGKVKHTFSSRRPEQVKDMDKNKSLLARVRLLKEIEDKA